MWSQENRISKVHFLTPNTYAMRMSHLHFEEILKAGAKNEVTNNKRKTETEKCTIDTYYLWCIHMRKKRIQTNTMFLIMSTWKKKTIFIVFVYPPDCLPQSTNKLNKKLAVDSLIKLDIIK